MARFYANENFPAQVVAALRAAGHDVLTVQETGRAGQAIADEEVLAFAMADDRAVLTLNRRHFIRLHQSRPDHGGIVVCTFDPDFESQARRIDAAINSLSTLSQHLVRVNRPPSP